MSGLRWIVLAVLVLGLLGIQHFGLERQPEKQAESEYSRLSNLPAGESVPTYISTLFFGPFRAIAIDILWIKLKTATDEHRWYVAKEIAELISFLQPRNQEVWQYLSWDFSYNVSHYARNEEEQWKWIRYGLLKLAEGCRRNPHSVHLRASLGMMLWHFPTRYHEMPMWLCKKIEADDQLQEELQEEHPVRVRKGPFELSVRWYELALVEIERYRSESVTEFKTTTQMGLIIYPSTLAGFMRNPMFFQAVYLWYQAVSPESPCFDEAKEWFRRASVHSGRVFREYKGMSPLFLDFEKFYGGMPQVVDKHRELIRAADRENSLALRGMLTDWPFKGPRRVQTLRAAREFLRAAENNYKNSSPHDIDESYVARKLVPVKRALSVEHFTIGGETKEFVDENEWNDIPGYATPLRLGKEIKGNLKPWPGDVDHYAFIVSPPPQPEGQSEEAPRNFSKKVTFQITDTKVPLRIRVKKRDADASRIPISSEGPYKSHDTVTVEVKEPLEYFLEVSAYDDSGPAPADTRYGVQLLKIE